MRTGRITCSEPCGSFAIDEFLRYSASKWLKKKNSQTRRSTDLKRFWRIDSELVTKPPFFIARQDKMAPRTRFCVSYNYFRLGLKGLNGEDGTARGLKACLQVLLAQPRGINGKSWFSCALFRNTQRWSSMKYVFGRIKLFYEFRIYVAKSFLKQRLKYWRPRESSSLRFRKGY